jgi:23S rRNA pseudouridine955/2504/2580 synthase/23S rRNA pseudouridine1911/1915/1917 synthase
VNAIRLSRDLSRSGRGWPAVEILYEDHDLLAVNKPAGLLAVPDRFDKAKPDLMSLLQAARPAESLANVHRLDFNTSGVFVVAKNREAFRNLVRQFRNRETRKTYVAIVRGRPAESPLTIDLPIGRHPKLPGRARIDHARGSSARSVVSIREKFRGFTLFEVVIETGRMHQIRVHLQAFGCPLVGDTDYGGAPLLLSQLKRRYKPKDDEPERPLLDRPALHAGQLTLLHPSTGKPFTITAPWPKDLTVAVKYLRKYAGT